MDSMSFGQLFKRARERYALTQEDAADKIHVGVQTVRRWEKDETVPQMGLRGVIATFLGVEISYLDSLIHFSERGGIAMNKPEEQSSTVSGPLEGASPLASQPLSKIEEAINNARLGWTLSIIGEDQSKKLADLTQGLRGRVSQIGDGKQITSGFSYWGIGPTLAWTSACTDPFYVVMKESIEYFSDRWSQTFPRLGSQKYHYVSLGVGTGHKDRDILRDLYKTNPKLYYFPVDMSPEMLRVGVQEAIKAAFFERRKILPIQIDFSIKRNVEECRQLLSNIVDEEPILFSLLGNTLANFENDLGLLKTISGFLRPQDRLLLEIAYTNDFDTEAIQEAAEEYSRSKPFREFAISALRQNTDISISSEDVSFDGMLEQERAIQVKALYRNITNSIMKITLPDSTHVDFPPDDTIRLYLTRKYTKKGSEEIVTKSGLSFLSREPSIHDPARSRFDFGMELLLLAPNIQ